MDLESECSALESVEDNEVIAPENLSEIKIETNGTCHAEHVDGKLLVYTEVEGTGVISPSRMAESHGGSIGLSPLAATKGYGLRKWRRLRREGSKEWNSHLDSSKKRVLPLVRGSGEMKQESEGSISSTNAIANGIGIAADRNALYRSDSGLVGGPILADGTDSENSQDCSSKSSTAASAPIPRYEIPPAVGFGHDKNGMRSGMNLGILGQRGGQQQGKGRMETSKKARGDRVKIEKENSHSSMESDSPSSKFVFVQGTNSATSNGRRSGMSANYDGENSDDAQDGEQHLNEGIRTGFRKNEAESEDVSLEDSAAELSWEIKEEKSENHGLSMDQNILVESIITLHSAQEALEKEVQKLKDVGKEDTLLFDDVNQPVGLPSQFTSDESRPSSSPSLETQMIGLKQDLVHLQSKLEESRVMLELKEAKVIELEATFNSSKLPKEETGSTGEIQQENYRDMETELEELFKQRIEAEVEYLAISRTIQKCRAVAIDQMTLLEQQKNLASEQVQVLNKLEDEESKATALKKQAEELETCCGEIVEKEEVLKWQNRVCRYTSCFFIQLILLVVVLYLIALKLSSPNGEVVPT